MRGVTGGGADANVPEGETRAPESRATCPVWMDPRVVEGRKKPARKGCTVLHRTAHNGNKRYDRTVIAAMKPERQTGS